MVDYVSRSTLARRPVEETRIGAYVRRLDWLMLGAVAALVGYGLWVIAGITRDDIVGNESYYVVRQGFSVGLGCAALLAAILIDPGVYRKYKSVLFGGVILLLLVVVMLGTEVRGSQRWLDIGFYRFQPSEFSKLLLVLFLAAFLADRGKRVVEVKTVAATVGLAAIPAALVFLQPDMGTALVYGAALISVLFFAGARWLHLGVLVALGAVLVTSVLWIAPAMGVQILKPYQTARLTAFANPEHDPGGSATTSTSRSPRSGPEGSAGAASRTRRRPTSTTSPSTRRTSSSHRLPSSEVSSGRRSCSCSTCS